MGCCRGGLGDLFMSDTSRKEREVAIESDKLQLEQQTKLLELLDKRAMYSGDTTSDKNKYLLLGGLAVLMLAFIIIKT